MNRRDPNQKSFWPPASDDPKEASAPVILDFVAELGHDLKGKTMELVFLASDLSKRYSPTEDRKAAELFERLSQLASDLNADFSVIASLGRLGAGPNGYDFKEDVLQPAIQLASRFLPPRFRLRVGTAAVRRVLVIPAVARWALARLLIGLQPSEIDFTAETLGQQVIFSLALLRTSRTFGEVQRQRVAAAFARSGVVVGEGDATAGDSLSITLRLDYASK